MKRALKILYYFCSFTVLVAFVYSMLFTKILIVRGTSMSPTYLDGDCLLSIATDSFKTGDVVSVYSEEAEAYIIKRVVAVAGDYVVSSPTEVIVNGDVIMEFPFMVGKSKTGIVPEGNVFLVGDNYIDSYDSRYFGSIPIGEKSYRVVPGLIIHEKLATTLNILITLLALAVIFILLHSFIKTVKTYNGGKDENET